MASKRRLRRRACEQKKRYESKEDATNHGVFDNLVAYNCPHCHGWHVGRRKQKQIRAVRQRRRSLQENNG